MKLLVSIILLVIPICQITDKIQEDTQQENQLTGSKIIINLM